jgi:hypothetical protein
MALTNYTELKASIADWLHRHDLTAQIPDFIRLAEVRLNRRLSLLQQELEATLTATVGSRLLTRPADMGTPLAMWLTTYEPRMGMVFRTPKELPVTDFNGQSQYWTVTSTNVETENPADLAYTYNLRYVAIFNLADTNTNTLLTEHPDCYLFGALLESAPFLRDASSSGAWAQRFEVAIKEAMSDSARNKSLANLRTDLPGTHSAGNILRGY